MRRDLISPVVGLFLLLSAFFFGGTARAWSPGPGLLVVQNDRIVEVPVVVDGRMVGEVTPGTSEIFYVATGTREVVVSKAPAPTLRQRVSVRSWQESVVVVPAFEGRLTVRNQTGRNGVLFVDGKQVRSLGTGTQATLVQSPGRHSVEIRSGSLVLAAAQPDVRSGQSISWLGEAPKQADMVVENPLPVPVWVRVEGQSPSLLSAHQVTTLRGVRVGRLGVEVRRLSGEPLVVTSLDVRPWDGARFVVPAPTESFVRLENSGPVPVTVMIGSRVLAVVPVRQDVRILAPVGWQELVLRPDKGSVLRTWVEMQPFEEVSLRFDTNRRSLSQERHPLEAPAIARAPQIPMKDPRGIPELNPWDQPQVDMMDDQAEWDEDEDDRDWGHGHHGWDDPDEERSHDHWDR